MSNFNFLKGNVDTIILNSLYQRDEYGYEIIKDIKEKSENKYEIKQPTLYTYLKRLEANRLISSYWGEESKGGRRRYYSLTTEGRNECDKYMAEWELNRTVLDNLVSDKTVDLLSTDTTVASSTFFTGKKHISRKTSPSFVSQQDEINLKIIELENELSRAKDTDEDTEKVNETDSVKVTEDEQLSLINLIDKTVTAKEIESKDIKEESEVESKDIKEVPNASPSTIFITETYIPQVRKVNDSENTPLNNEEKQQENVKSIVYKHIINDLVGRQLENSLSEKDFVEDIATKPIMTPNSLTEIAETLAKEGYRIKIYNKSSVYVSQVMLHVNKLNFWSVFTSSCLLLAELLIFWLTTLSIVKIPVILFIVLGATLVAINIYFLVILLKCPAKKVKPKFDFKYHFINSLITTVLLVVLLAIINLLFFKTVFINLNEVLLQIILPLIIIVNIPLSVITYKIFLKKMIY